MTAKLYYTAPPDEAFNDMKRVAIAVWNTYDNEYGYADEKIERIKDIANVKDNFMYIFAMFDIDNQRFVASRLKKETREAVKARMIDGGATISEVRSIFNNL